jgi:hypothetical protein
MTSAVGRSQRAASGWDQIEYWPAPAGELVAPEDHWPAFASVDLTPAQRVGLNHLAMRFSCEMFVHFERYVIDYICDRRRDLSAAVTGKALDRFVAEEHVHIDAFYRLLASLRPDAYRERRLSFLRWSFWDGLVVRLSPIVTFFVAAALIEEMSLRVSDVMDARPDQSFPPAHAVMSLHALEERSHVAIDEQIVSARSRGAPAFWLALQVIASLLIVVHVDRKTTAAWRLAVRAHADELGLSAAHVRALGKKGLSRSDQLGLSAFIDRRTRKPLPGSRVLCAALSRALR